jgi:hypothetical protein
VHESGSNQDNHFVALLSNPETKRNKSNFESLVNRLMELKKSISVIAVDFSPLDTKSLCHFLNKAIPKFIEIGCVTKNVKLYLPVVFQSKLEILQSKKCEVRKTEQDYFMRDVDGDNFEKDFLYVDYGLDIDDLDSKDTENSTSSKKSSVPGIHFH